MPRSVLLAVVIATCLPASAAVRRHPTAAQCRKACGTTIQQCVDAGQRLRKCKRQVVRRCRSKGLSTCALAATTHHVATTGFDTAGCGDTSGPCRTIQYVIDNQIPLGGDGTIKVATGTFDDSSTCLPSNATSQAVVCIVNKRITLLGGFTPPNWDTPTADPSATVLDGKDQGRGVRVQRTGPKEPVASLRMEAFTIQNAFAEGSDKGDISQTYAFGAAMFVEQSPATLRNMIFRENKTVGGSTNQSEGGRGAGGALAFTGDGSSGGATDATLQNVTFQRNEARGGSGLDRGGYALGGALFIYGLRVTGDGLVFENNLAAAGPTNGAGISGTETSDGLGGAVAVEVDGSADLRHLRATDNVAIGGDAPNGMAGGGFGGALFAELGTMTVTDAVVEGNRAQSGTGRNSPASGSTAQGGAIHTVRAGLVLDRTFVVGNEAHVGDGTMSSGAVGGGGVAITYASGPDVAAPFTIRNSVIANNLASLGSGGSLGGGAGGLWVQGASGTIEYSTIANNRLGDDRLLGAGITIVDAPGWQSQATVRDSIIGNHTQPAFDPTSYANAALYVMQNTTADVSEVLFANNAHDSNAGVSGGLNLPAGTINMTSTFSAPDAGFVSAGAPNDDYHLVASSPAVDRATTTDVPVDMDGNARPNGTAADLGAYELIH